MRDSKGMTIETVVKDGLAVVVVPVRGFAQMGLLK